MTQRLHHRGPDDGGAVVFSADSSTFVERRLGRVDEPVQWPHVPTMAGLGARRLAIIDRSAAGHQPMSAREGQLWLVYNGEIYNHATLRQEIQNAGTAFTGHSDTEVVLAAYRSWGAQCFERFSGMWAAAILDRSSGKLILSRDRFGIKPLYVTRYDGGIAFASEIKSLLLLPGVGAQVNEQRLLDFLALAQIDHTDQTLFDGIWSVPAGCWIEIDLHALNTAGSIGRLHRFWQPDWRWSQPDDAVDQVRNRLISAVESHLIGEAPVGTCLSGGIDSSSIAGILYHQLKEKWPDTWSQHAFTASLPNTPQDETQYAQKVAESCAGLHWHRVEPQAEDIPQELDQLLWHQEQPFGSPGIYLQWAVMRQAKASGVTVLLDGQGGDELFCGYEGYIPFYLAHLLTRGCWLRLLQEFYYASKYFFSPGSLLGHSGAALLDQQTHNQWRRRRALRQSPWLADEFIEAETCPGLIEGLSLETTEDSASNVTDSTIKNQSNLPRLQRHILRVAIHDSLPALLRYEDRNAMAFSIETRVPFLDHHLAELAICLPVDAKIQKGCLKKILRDAMCNLIPQAVAKRRDKIGFGQPVAQWMAGPLKPWWNEMIKSRSFSERGCFDMQGIDQLVKRFETRHKTADALRLWRIALTEHWARRLLG